MNSTEITSLRLLRKILSSAQIVYSQSHRLATGSQRKGTRLLIPAEILLGPNPFGGTREDFLDRLRRHQKPLAKLRHRVASGDRVSLLIQNRDAIPTLTQRQYLREVLPGIRFVTVQTPADAGSVPSDTVAPASHQPAE